MSKTILSSIFAFTGCAVFTAAGLWTAFGGEARQASLFSRAGGVAFAALFLWAAVHYAVQLRRKLTRRAASDGS